MATKYFGGLDLAQIGTLTASFIVSLGLATVGSLLVQGTVQSNLIPSSNATYDVGASTSSWRAGYFNNVSSTNATTTNLYSTNVTSTAWLGFNVASGSSLTVGAISLNGTSISGGQNATFQASPSSSIITTGSTSTRADHAVKVNNFIWGTNYVSSTITLMDVTNPAAPTLAYSSSSVASFPSPWYMAQDGKFVFVSNLYSNQVTIFNANFVTSSQPQMIITGPFGTTGTAALVADGRYLYKAGTTGTIDVLDYGNLGGSATIPASTQLSLGAGSTVAQMVKYGNFLYVNYYAAGNSFSIIDVTKPMNPVIAAQMSTVGTGWGVAVQNNKAYVSDWLATKLYVIDVSQPYSPRLLTTVSNAEVYPSVLLASGPYLYIENYNTQAGVGVWDIVSATPTRLGTIGAGNYSFSDLIVDGQYLYLFDHYLGIHTLDVLTVPFVKAQAVWGGVVTGGQLKSQGDAIINNNLTVNGSASFGLGITAKGNSQLDNVNITNATATGPVLFQSTVSSTGGITVTKSGAAFDWYSGTAGTPHGELYADGSTVQIGTLSNTSLLFFTNNSTRLTISSSEFQPGVDNAIALGDLTHRYTNAFFNGTVSSTGLTVVGSGGTATTTAQVGSASHATCMPVGFVGGTQGYCTFSALGISCSATDCR